MFTIPTSLKSICAAKPPYSDNELKCAWQNYLETKTPPESKEDRLILASILNLNRTEYSKITGMKRFQSPYLTVHNLLVDNTVEAHKALLESIPSNIEKLLVYPSISIALYAKAALELGKLPDMDKLALFVQQKGNNFAYRLSSGLLTSAEEALDLDDPFFNKVTSYVQPMFYKRLFLQGSILVASPTQETPYDVTNPLTLYTRRFVEDTPPTTSDTPLRGVVSDVVSGCDTTNPIAPIFSRSDVTTLDEVKRVWAKLKTFKCFTYKSLANSIRDKLSDQEKIAAINLINQTRPNYTEITGHSKLASPLHILMRKPVDHITREEHIALRELLLEEGGLTAMYLLYPSLSVAVQAQAALATGWPEGGKELAIKHKEFADHCGATYQNRLNVRFLKRNVDEPDDPFYKEMRKIVPLNATRHVYQAAVAFCKVPCTSMYDINNIVTLKGECISPWGAELPENQFITKGRYRL